MSDANRSCKEMIWIVSTGVAVFLCLGVYYCSVEGEGKGIFQTFKRMETIR